MIDHYWIDLQILETDAEDRKKKPAVPAYGQIFETWDTLIFK